MVRFPDLDKEIESTIGFVSRFIDPTNRTFQVECKIKSDDVVLRANMIAYLKIKDYINDRAVCLPVNFVQKSSDGNYVYVAEQKGPQWIATRRPVETGMDYNGTIEILKGLNEGDKVISSGYQNLTEGAIINF